MSTSHLTPHHQYPTTVTLSPGRRLALLELALRERLLVLEDDYDHRSHRVARPGKEPDAQAGATPWRACRRTPPHRRGRRSPAGAPGGPRSGTRDPEAWASRARDRERVLAQAGPQFSLPQRAVPFLRLGFGRHEPRELLEAVRRLARALPRGPRS